MVKTLILDIDNTLIEAMKELPLRSEAALRRWLAAGHRLVFASGKNACAFDDLIALLRMRKAGILLPTAVFWQNPRPAGLSGWRASGAEPAVHGRDGSAGDSLFRIHAG